MLAAIVTVGVFGSLVGAYLPGVARRVPAGRSVLGRPGGEQPGVTTIFAVATAATFAGFTARFGLSADLPAYLYLAAVSVVLAAIDLRHHRLPDALTLPSYPIVAALLGVAALERGDGGAYVRALLGMVALFGLYLLMHVIYPAGMGFGDVKLAGVLGLGLGWLGWGVLGVGTVLGFLAGGAVGIGLLLTGRASRTSAIPYGPLMLVGAVAAILWGAQIADWYAGRSH